MKAKEYAEKIIVRSHDLADTSVEVNEAMTRAGCEAAIEILKEVRADSLRCRTVQAKLGAFRAGLTKWKAVVRAVHALMLDHPVTDNYLGIFIASDNPEAYQELVNNKVFLGYEFSNTEQQILREVSARQRDAEFNARVNWTIQRIMMIGR